MKCPNPKCGYEKVLEDDKFCGICGISLRYEISPILKWGSMIASLVLLLYFWIFSFNTFLWVAIPVTIFLLYKERTTKIKYGPVWILFPILTLVFNLLYDYRVALRFFILCVPAIIIDLFVLKNLKSSFAVSLMIIVLLLMGFWIVPIQPAEIQLTDMELVTTKVYKDNNASNAMVEVYSKIYNYGGDSIPLTMQVTLSADDNTKYTGTVDLGVVNHASGINSKVNFDLPRDKNYSFAIEIFSEEGKGMDSKHYYSSGRETIKLNELNIGTPKIIMLSKLMEEPGFEIVFALIGIFLAYNIYNNQKNKKVKYNP